MPHHSSASVPRHVAIIMDGNGRWAQQRRLPRAAGHRAGVKATRRIVREAARRGVEVLSLFAFSSENWYRPASEVGLLMDLFLRTLQREVEDLRRHDIRIRFVGDHDAFPVGLREQMERAESITAGNSGLDLVVAVGYGGRWDMAQAARALARDVEDGRLQAADVDAERLGARLSLARLPDPDLFVRTGGEYRISNFLLWNLAYTELYFTDVLWPDFDEAELELAINWFAGRERRFGRVVDAAAR